MSSLFSECRSFSNFHKSLPEARKEINKSTDKIKNAAADIPEVVSRARCVKSFESRLKPANSRSPRKEEIAEVRERILIVLKPVLCIRHFLN